MTDTSPHPPGLVTDAEAEILADPDTDLDEHSELRARLRTRLTETIHDFSMLYPTLPADDLAAVFASDDAEALAPVRTGTQDGLALLMLGMLLGDDMIEMRLRDAIQNAGLSYGEDIDATLELRRGPLPTLEQFATQLDDEGLTEQTLPLFEYFLHQPETDSEEFEHIASKLHIDVTPDEKAEIDTAMTAFERPPQTVVTAVSVTDASDDDLDPDT
ncbi:hypothetical protein [Haloplanus salilacus]|uniref:hypothetical protein n=1 Tax=Haloplanus salilacus TaxID=2949994 RepID=UPI0030D590CA